MKTRIIHVLWSANMGGIAKLLLDLIIAQKKNPSLNVSLLIARHEGALLDRFVEITDVHYLNIKNGNDISVSAYKKAKVLFRQNDIVHIHSFNPLVALAAKNSGTKIIYTEHGNFGFGKKKGLSWQVVTKLLKKFLNNSVSAITFNSEFTKKTAVARYGLSRVKQEVIYNGIPFPFKAITVTDQDILNKLNDNFVIGCIARLAGVKRIDKLIRSFSLLPKDKNFVLLLIGDGPLMHELNSLAHQSGVADAVIFAGNRDNARSYIPLMDICSLTSENEAFGLVAIEAFESGKPVIVFSDGGGLTELVSRVDKDDIVNNESGFAKRIEYYYSNRQLLNDEVMIQKRKSFAAQFSIEQMEQKLFNLYTNVRN